MQASVIKLEKPVETREMKFPVLMKHRDYPVTVLFANKTTGIVVQSGDKAYPVGQLSSNWTNADDKLVWNKLSPNQAIQLSNDE